MGANNSTRRVSFESDENENVTIVKGIRLSENVINRMRESAAPQKQAKSPPPSPESPPTRFDPPKPLLEPFTVPQPPPATEPVAPPAAPPPVVSTPVEPVASPPPALAPASELAASQPVEVIAPRSPAESVPPAISIAEAVAPLAVKEPVAPPPLPPVDEKELRRKITEELQKGLEEERSKARQDLNQWLEKEKAQAHAKAHADAQAQVQDEVSRILAAERVASQDSVQRAVLRERISTEDERLRAQLYAKQLEARDQELRKQDAFYREQVAKLEQRSAQFYKVTNENYHKAADEVNAKFKRYEISPVCTDLQGQILKCYRENTGKTLLCSNIASQYLQCVNSAKQNNKFEASHLWENDLTS
ncbi:coiled-coil-helix-coiled-coil-helix domain containing 3a isoform X2 [Astyanax mexicanus]|uniref:coiled-coil-helix-coiled-coil-helix domain containing 3a isoform X2 n=1 Tax=Astyanax mexicanus TaxID=7994 RepID=UPI0020CB0231|nr:coiled-coil-helix-coiled-coil-helix domain containing 3a isoform X2 [Astyanax mexicanus]